MKFPTVKALAKHLRDASPDHFATIYMIIAKESFVRDEALKALLDRLAGEQKIGVKTFEGEKLSLPELLQELDTYSFFAGKRVIVVRRLQEAPKPVLKQLESYLSSPNTGVYLILEAEEINRATNVFKLSEKNGVVLDVPEEKPWEKQKAVQEWLAEQAQKIGCVLAPDAQQLIVQQLGTDVSMLAHELEKLALYAGERKQITVADVHAVCATVNTQNIWQLGDAIMRRDPASALAISSGLMEDGLGFMSLVRSLRSQFQTKYQVCSILSRGGTPVDVACQFAYMKGRILDQNCQLAQNYGMDRFRDAMLKIDETEALAKSMSVDDELLADLLIARLAQ